MEPDNSYSFVSVKQISSNLDWKVGEFRLHIYLVIFHLEGRYFAKNASDTIYSLEKIRISRSENEKILSLISNETRFSRN